MYIDVSTFFVSHDIGCFLNPFTPIGFPTYFDFHAGIPRFRQGIACCNQTAAVSAADHSSPEYTVVTRFFNVKGVYIACLMRDARDGNISLWNDFVASGKGIIFASHRRHPASAQNYCTGDQESDCFFHGVFSFQKRSASSFLRECQKSDPEWPKAKTQILV